MSYPLLLYRPIPYKQQTLVFLLIILSFSIYYLFLVPFSIIKRNAEKNCHSSYVIVVLDYI